MGLAKMKKLLIVNCRIGVKAFVEKVSLDLEKGVLRPARLRGKLNTGKMGVKILHERLNSSFCARVPLVIFFLFFLDL